MEASRFITEYLGPKYDGLGAPYRIDPVGLRNQAMDSGKQVTGFNTGQVLDMSNALQNNAINAIGGIQAGFNNPYQTGAKWYADNYGMGQVPVMNWTADRMGDFSGVLTGRAWSDYNAGPNALENQIFGAGQNALQERANEIGRGATDVSGGALGQALLGDATRRLQSAGRLTPQEERDVAQSTRASFAARGLATSAPAAMTEALNRDRFSRQRMSEDRAYAQAVQGDDIGRQQMNAQRQLSALQSNQSANMNQLAQNRGFMIDAANTFTNNQLGRMGQAGNILSLGANLLGQAGSLRGAAGNLGLSGAQTMADLDPYARSLDAGLRLGNMTQGLANESVLTNFGNMLDLGANADSFNVNMLQDRENAWINNATAAFTGQQAANSAREAANISSAANLAAARAARPKWYETAIGGITNMFSDKRMKTDIKPLGKAGSVLGLTAYEFRYKGDKKKHKGFMAQDVQKVLPEAVEEKNYKGKKRLTIKPAVIGAALAEELMTAKAA